MTTGFLVFVILALVAVASALAMLFSRNPVYCTLFLIINFCTIAVFYLILSAPFLAMAQITVYAGAIMVLFLFVIMLLGGEGLPPGTTIRWQRPLAVVLGLGLLTEVIYVLVTAGKALPAMSQTLSASFGNPADIGNVLFDQYLLPFEVTSILLLIAMIGAIVLTQSEKKRQGKA
jgi:NADH-quinone oxidoreductase subunit J